MTDTLTTTDVPLPGMPTPPDLWAVHVQAADELVPFLDRAEAEKLATFLDEQDAKERTKNLPHSVFYNAKLIEWPYSRDEFAEALREEAWA
ncbi:hypothetical protein ACFYUR_18570 [Micromonospora haikouensis]|uniref:hypothetical protein n=1 Tax=Micromonospora haikouensis TaxID=686309 RepID=UPI0036C84A3C